MTRILAIATFLLLSGCATVEPWQRGYLARPDMASGGGHGAGRILDKAYAAKEASAGGDAVGGGGCGCN